MRVGKEVRRALSRARTSRACDVGGHRGLRLRVAMRRGQYLGPNVTFRPFGGGDDTRCQRQHPGLGEPALGVQTGTVRRLIAAEGTA
jgi:hypothetical protein